MTRRELLKFAAAATAARALFHSPNAVAAQTTGPAPAPGAADDIAMLIYPGFTALDLVGPYHFLGGMPRARVHLVTIQADLRPVPSDIGLAIQPTATLADCPSELAIIFTPGGTTGTLAAARDPRTLAFIRHHAERARYVTSVCTGSLILGAAGALRGKRATSDWSVVPLLSNFGATPVRERVVRDGKVITGAGVSAGMDFGATLVAEMHGQRVAEAGILMAEYAPEPPFPTGSIEQASPDLVALLERGLSGFVAGAAQLRIQQQGDWKRCRYDARPPAMPGAPPHLARGVLRRPRVSRRGDAPGAAAEAQERLHLEPRQWDAVEGALILGFIGLVENHVGGLFVAPAAHRRGVGRLLLEHASGRLRGLTVEVYEQNRSACSFYGSCGFEPIQ